MKSFGWIIVAITALMFVFVFLFISLDQGISGSTKEKKRVEEQVLHCLIDNYGYQESDITSIKGVYDTKHEKYAAQVIFKDEPNTIYTYQLRGDSKIISFGVIESGKHLIKAS